MLVDQSHNPRHVPSRGSQAADTEPSLVGDGCSAERWRAEAARAFQHYLDRAAPRTARRWAGTLAAAVVYALRVYVVTYRLGIYLLNLLIGILSPMVDPEVEALEARPRLPIHGSDEFKPFNLHLPPPCVQVLVWLEGKSSGPWSCSRKGRSLQTAHGKVDGGCSLGRGSLLGYQC